MRFIFRKFMDKAPVTPGAVPTPPANNLFPQLTENPFAPAATPGADVLLTQIPDPVGEGDPAPAAPATDTQAQIEALAAELAQTRAELEQAGARAESAQEAARQADIRCKELERQGMTPEQAREAQARETQEQQAAILLETQKQLEKAQQLANRSVARDVVVGAGLSGEHVDQVLNCIVTADEATTTANANVIADALRSVAKAAAKAAKAELKAQNSVAPGNGAASAPVGNPNAAQASAATQAANAATRYLEGRKRFK